MLGIGEILFLTALVLVVWNARRIPELVKSLRSSGKAFKKGLDTPDERPSRDINPDKK